MLSPVSKDFYVQKICRKGTVHSETQSFWSWPDHERWQNQQEASDFLKSNILAALKRDWLVEYSLIIRITSRTFPIAQKQTYIKQHDIILFYYFPSHKHGRYFSPSIKHEKNWGQVGRQRMWCENTQCKPSLNRLRAHPLKSTCARIFFFSPDFEVSPEPQERREKKPKHNTEA